MRWIAIALALCGCRNVIGIPEETTVRTFEVDGTITGVIGASATVQLMFDEYAAVPEVDGPFAITGVANGTTGRVASTSNVCKITNGDVAIDGASAMGVDVKCDGLVALGTFEPSAPLDSEFRPGTLMTNLSASTIVQESRFSYAVAYPGPETQAKATGMWGSFGYDPGLLEALAPSNQLVVTVDSPGLQGLFAARTYSFSIATTASPAVFGYGKAAAPAEEAYFGAAVAAAGAYYAVAAPGKNEVTVYQRSGRMFVEKAVLTGLASDTFGTSVAMTKTRIVVGARSTSNATGKVYVFNLVGDQWQAGPMLQAATPTPSDGFGTAVAVDDSYILVGAPADVPVAGGSAYLYDVSGALVATWRPAGGTAGDQIGASVALPSSIAFSRAVVGAPFTTVTLNTVDVYPRAGVAYGYDPANPTSAPQVLTASVVGADDRFATSLAADGSYLLVGAPLEDSGSATDPTDNSKSASGAAYLFTFTTTWTQIRYIKPSTIDSGDNFGRALAIRASTSGQTRTIAIGAPFEDSSSSSTTDETATDAGAVYVYRLDASNNLGNGSYAKASQIGAGDQFGAALALTPESLLVGAPYEDGATSGWNQVANEDALDAGAVFAVR